MLTQKEKERIYEKILAIREIMIEHGFPVRKIVNVKYSNSISTYGTCERHKNNTVTITISEITVRDKSLNNTIIHELCHAIDIPNNNNHNYVWKQLANKAGNIFNENIVRCAKTSKEYIEEKRNRYKYTIKCKDCGYTYYYMKESQAIKNISHGNSRKYHCKCGSHNLKVDDYREHD